MGIICLFKFVFTPANQILHLPFKTDVLIKLRLGEARSSSASCQ
jgi:hypothetical protein